jgi:hypothetical protein
VNAAGTMHGLLKLATVTAATLVLAACGGGATTEQRQPNNLPPTSDYTGPAPATTETQAFMTNIWTNVRASGVGGGGAPPPPPPPPPGAPPPATMT